MKEFNYIIILFLVSSSVFPQNLQSISGRVVDKTDQSPIEGANIQIKGSNSGTITDSNGYFVLNNVEPGIEISITHIVYNSILIRVESKNLGTIEMVPNNLILEEIVTLGSRGTPRSKLETPVPVDVITMSDIEAYTPQTEISQILNYQAPSFSSNRQTISDGTDHVDPAVLRGLSVDHVLVLVNGKRRHTSALINVNGSVGRGSVGTDLNSIPANAIKRIEILRDGAAAQYGSDAIAGVINIILKDDVNELSASSTVGQYYEGDGETAQFNINYGFKVGKRGFINLSSQYQFRGMTDRAGEWTGSVFRTSHPMGDSLDINGTPVLDNNGNKISVPVKGLYSELYEEGDFSPFDLGQRLTQTQANSINRANSFTNNMTPEEEEALIAATGGRRAYTMKVGQSEVVNASFMINSSFDLSEDAQVYLFGGLNSRNGKASGFYRLPNQSRTLTSVFPTGFLPEINPKILDGSITLGINGNIGYWNADFSNTYGINTFDYIIENSINASMGNRTPTSFEAGGFSFQQNTTNFDMTRYFDNALNGINVAFGSEYRVETYTINAGEESSYRNYGIVSLTDTLNNGTPFINSEKTANIFYDRPGGSQVFPGFQPTNEVSESRSTIGFYADSEFNFSKFFFVDAALRFENYTDFGSTFNWKIATRYSITDNIAVRAAISTGFRAPSLHQRYFNNTATLFSLVNGVSVPTEVGTFRNDSRVAQLFGIPSLKNESTFNYSAGITYGEPDQLSISADGYYVLINDRVVLTNQFSAGSSPEIAAILNQVNASRAQFFVNAIDTKTMGIDLITRYVARLGSGKLITTLAGNYTQTIVEDIHIPSQLQAAPTSFFNRSEKGRFQDLVPNSKITLGFNYKIGKLNSQVSFVRFGEVWDRSDDKEDSSDPNSPYIDQKYSAKIITDVSVGYQITPIVNLVLGANNLFDIYPDENRSEFRSGERFIYSREAQQFGFNGGYYFARVNVKLK